MIIILPPRDYTTLNNNRRRHITCPPRMLMGLVALAMAFPIISAFTYSSTTTTIRKTPRLLSRQVVVSPINYNFMNDRRSNKLLFASQSDNEEEYDEDEEEMPPIINGFELDDSDDDITTLTLDELQPMTVPQLKQQLRLRGKKVSGNKSELMSRLLDKTSSSGVSMDNSDDIDVGDGYSKYQKPYTSSSQTTKTNESSSESKRVVEAKSRGAEIVDVTEFLEDEKEWKTNFRSSDRKKSYNDEAIDAEVEKENKDDDTSTSSSSSSSSSPEVWGEDAKIVEDYEGRSIVVDGLSRTVIEYKGSNNTIVQAYVVGSRESLRKFLRGGTVTDNINGQQQQQKMEDGPSKTVYSSMEEEVLAIQRKREMESKRGLIRPDEVEGVEDKSDPGTYYQHIERDYGDWGVYTPTGAQLSSLEVQGVLLLSDVYGPFTENTQALADKIAFECQPVVVFVPDMFRGDPWTMNPTVDEEDGVARNEKGKSYEEWRASHPDRRVDVDIRAAAAVLREKYAVSSIAVWGTCYGGGRALEAAAGWYEGGASSYYEDAFSDRRAPPHVDPIACISWYPTRYDANKLFGKNNEGFRTFESGEDRKVAVMAVFAENDSLPGATPEDATLLRSSLEDDQRVVDFMVKVFPGQKHGFAHAHLGQQHEVGGDDTDRFVDEGFGSVENVDPLTTTGGDAEVACLLSTAWMETYTRVFLPTVGTPVRDDEENSWSSTLDMNFQAEQREIRKELENSITTFEDVSPDLGRMSQSRSPLLDGDANEAYDRIEEERERIKQEILTKYGISPDDDDETFNSKFAKAMADGALDRLLIDAYVDDSGDAYW